MLTKMQETDADIVIGSRFCEQRKDHSARMMGSRLITSLIRMRTHQTITDPTSGLRMYNKRMIKLVGYDVAYTPEPDTLAYLIGCGAKVEEVQVEMDERMFGTSYLNLWNSIKYMATVVMSSVNRHPSIWKALIRRSFYEQYHLRFHAYVSYEDDLLMIVHLLSVAKKVCTVKYRGYLWYINMASESHARKYIDDMGQKQRKWVDDICASVALTDASPEIKNYTRQVTNCKVFVDAILNLCSPYRRETFSDIPQYYAQNIYCYDFEDAMQVAGYAQKKFPMQRYILHSLAKHHTYRSYFVARILVFALDKVLKSKMMIKLDSLLKGNG